MRIDWKFIHSFISEDSVICIFTSVFIFFHNYNSSKDRNIFFRFFCLNVSISESRLDQLENVHISNGACKFNFIKKNYAFNIKQWNFSEVLLVKFCQYLHCAELIPIITFSPICHFWKLLLKLEKLNPTKEMW